MRPRGIVSAALVAGLLGHATSFEQDAGLVTVLVRVERAEPLTDAAQLVPWRLMRNLAREDFEILSDSLASPIESFSTADGPLSIVLIADVSASSEIKPDWLPDPLKEQLILALKAGDRVCVGRFGGTELRLQPGFTGEARSLLSAARDLLRPSTRELERTAGAPWARPLVQARSSERRFGIGPSPVWDAVDAAVTAVESEPGRRAVILVTDGRSTANVHSLNEVIEHALASDVALNIVSGATEQIIRQTATTVARVRPSLNLEEMARYTGGACVSIFGSEPFRPQPWAANGERDTKLWVGRALARVVDELHQAYTLRFSPAALDGRLHALEVRVTKPGLTVRARRGYLAPRGQ